MQISKKLNLETMTVDEMWQLHEEISQILSVRLASEKRELEKRLAQLRREKQTHEPRMAEGKLLDSGVRARRKYPRVFPKYQNPNDPLETWSGRGKQPRWLAAALKAGRTIDEFVIGRTESPKETSRRRRA